MPTPTYSLPDVLALVRSGARRVTVTAEGTARSELGMSPAEVFAAVARLQPSDFYKTMASLAEPGLFQDVYRPLVVCPAYPRGVRVYCKIQVQRGVVVISFKRL